MDYRERKYYLIRLQNYNEDIKILKDVAPSLKCNKPYNHFRDKGSGSSNIISTITGLPSIVFDGDIIEDYFQVLVSCRFEDVDNLEKQFNIFIESTKYFNYCELTKRYCKQ